MRTIQPESYKTSDEIHSSVSETIIERFEHYTIAKKVSDTSKAINTFTLYKVDNSYLVVDPSDSLVYLVENYEDTAKVYKSLTIKNFFNNIISIATLALNVALLVKILKKKGWFK